MGKPHPVSMKSSTKLNRSVTTVAAAAGVADASSISATIGKATDMDACKRTGRIANTTSLLGSIRRASRRSEPGLEGSGHVIARASAAPSIVPQFTESRFGVKPPRGRPFRVQKLERETGDEAPSTKHRVEFSYRLASESNGRGPAPCRA